MKKLEKENIEVILMGMTSENGEQTGFQAIDGLISNLGNKITKKGSVHRGLKYRTELHQLHMNHIARTFGEISSEDLDKLQTYFYPMLKTLSVRSGNLLKKILRTKKVNEKDMLKTIVDPQFFMDITRKHSIDKVREIERLILQLYQILKNENASKSADTVQLLQYIIPYKMENLDKYLNENNQLMVFRYLNDTFENTYKFTSNEKKVIRNYFMKEEKLTLRELGEQLGVSFERIRQIIHKLTEILNDVAILLAGKAECLPGYFKENEIGNIVDIATIINNAEGVYFNTNFYEIFFNE